MKILFFDMEFANGRVKGSIYSIGYVITNEDFEILEPPTDLLINPDCEWNGYVLENILAYPREEIESSSNFYEVYDSVRALFESVDLAVGFALSNDTGALRAACVRYGLEPMNFRWLDTERLCRLMEEHADAHGLAGCVRAWCGEEPENQHRSDGDALATMMLLRAICRAKHVTPDMLAVAYPTCVGNTKNQSRCPQNRAKGRGMRRGRRPNKHTAKADSTPKNGS